MTTPELIEKQKAQLERMEKWLESRIVYFNSVAITELDKGLHRELVAKSSAYNYSLTKLREIFKP